VRKLALICVAVLVLGAIAFAAGCGGTAQSLDAEKPVSPGEFKTLQEARASLMSFVQDMRQAVGADTQAERSTRIKAAIKKHSRDWPLLPSGMSGPKPLTAKEKDRLKGTPTSALLALKPAAGEVGRDYLSAADTLYGVNDFDDYLLKHTLDGGTRPNTADPPEYKGGGFLNFGWHGAGMNPGPNDGIGVNIQVDPTTDTMIWTVGAAYPQQADIPTVEGLIIESALRSVQSGDSVLIPATKL
jgi:hypothetical protein